MTTPLIALCLEQTLGHRAHSANLGVAAACQDQSIDIVHVEYPERPRVKAPWAFRGSVAACRQMRARIRRPDIALFHTQTISLFASRAARGKPYAVSVDATPVQLDEMGAQYQHRRGPALIESAKRRWYRASFAGAAGVVAWSSWAADSLAADYGVPRERIFVIHPGATAEFFDIQRTPHTRRPRILFVGGDFVRKGGPTLLQAFERVRDRADLTLVTNGIASAPPGIDILRDIRPATPELFATFSGADIFCLPTLADCTSVAIGEAMAAGLPVITTTVGSNSQTVRDGESGLLVPPGDVAALASALERMVDDATLRESLGRRAREEAHAHLDASVNAGRLFDLLAELA
jgi:glycosyltransferase involved in cell wall biosynthesis